MTLSVSDVDKAVMSWEYLAVHVIVELSSLLSTFIEIDDCFFPPNLSTTIVILQKKN